MSVLLCCISGAHEQGAAKLEETVATGGGSFRDGRAGECVGSIARRYCRATDGLCLREICDIVVGAWTGMFDFDGRGRGRQWPGRVFVRMWKESGRTSSAPGEMRC